MLGGLAFTPPFADTLSFSRCHFLIVMLLACGALSRKAIKTNRNTPFFTPGRGGQCEKKSVQKGLSRGGLGDQKCCEMGPWHGLLIFTRKNAPAEKVARRRRAPPPKKKSCWGKMSLSNKNSKRGAGRPILDSIWGSIWERFCSKIDPKIESEIDPKHVTKLGSIAACGASKFQLS